MDDSVIEGLVVRAANGDDAAWQELWRLVEPDLTQLVGQPRFLGRP